MENELVKYASRFMELTEEEAHAIAEEIPLVTYKKGTILLKAGEISRECFFILKGCIRQYYLIDGEEKTTAFYTEEQAVVSFTSYSQQIPSSHSFSCTEDSLLAVGYLDKETDMYQRFPKLESFSRMFVEQDYGKAQDAHAAFITSSPEERYLNLLNTRPDLLQRVPLNQVASYLGMTPESLSRIRKRIHSKK